MRDKRLLTLLLIANTGFLLLVGWVIVSLLGNGGGGAMPGVPWGNLP